MKDKKVAAIVMAAGFSSRMHAFKPLLPLMDSTVVETTVAVFQKAGILNVTVVIGHERERMASYLAQCGIDYVVNEAYALGMFGSIQVGEATLKSDMCAFFVMPVDIPSVKPSTISLLTEYFDADQMDVLYPTYRDKRGHPPLISSRLSNAIRTFGGQGGLKALLNDGRWRISHLEVDDEGILMDIDDQGAYEEMFKKMKG